VRSYGFLVNDYYDGYITNYDGRKGIAIYANKVHVPVKEFEKSDIIGRAIRNGWVYDEANGFWIKGNLKFKHLRGAIFEVFDYGEYEPLDVKGRIVIDAGAFIGDSAIYFALKGAKKVIAIEPYPSAHAEMLENIKLNSLEGLIVTVNAGLASKPSKICVEDANVGDIVVTYHRPGNCSNTVPAVTLGELMEKIQY
jgi:FkbM family methyltransferase